MTRALRIGLGFVFTTGVILACRALAERHGDAPSSMVITSAIDDLREMNAEHERMMLSPHDEVWMRPVPIDGGWNHLVCHNMRFEWLDIVHGSSDAGVSGVLTWRCTQ